VLSTIKNPTWVPPPSIRAEHAAAGDPLPSVVPPGPDNPLGGWAVQLGAKGYFIHGTNKDLGVGMRVSHGCMRMYNGDVEEFAQLVKRGTPVRIINAPVKAGWKGGSLYVEVHDALEEQRAIQVPEADVADAIHMALRVNSVDVNWVQAKAAAVHRSGLPVRVSTESIAIR
jgi:L,D-transpeptidase ErfK/SrfK